MMQHLFLTGRIQVGKSTILRALLARCNLPVGGFQTFFGPAQPDGSTNVYMIGAMDSRADLRPEHVVAHRFGQGKFEIYPEAFDRLGVSLLKNAASYPIILMDELGFMESRAMEFQKAVLDCLDGEVPVLGVVKPMQTPFLQRVQNHPKVHLLWTSVDNRETVLQAAIKCIHSPGCI